MYYFTSNERIHQIFLGVKGGKNMSFFARDDNVLDKYNEIWDVIEKKLKIKFHSMPVYDEKYLKTKVRECDGVIYLFIHFIHRRLQLLVKNMLIQIDKEIHSYHKKKVNLNILDLL